MSYIWKCFRFCGLLTFGLAGGNPWGFGQTPRDWFASEGARPRPTLMQWSYGTSFSGGPDLTQPMATDRPDFTEASSTVGRRVLQVETGYTYASNKHGADRTNAHSYPETLVRYGILAEWLELRVAGNFAAQRLNADRDSGFEDLYLGTKLGLTPQEGILPEMALMPQMMVPTGGSAFSSHEVLPGLNWLYGWDINDFLSAAGSTQFNRTLDGTTSEAYTELAQSWTFGYAFGEKLGGYTEWFGLLPHGAETDKPQYYFNGGFIYRVTNNLQLDVRAGVGLNGEANDYFLGPGLSFRTW